MNEQKKKLVPELRFPEFANEDGWERKPIGDGFERVTTKNTENNQNTLTISAQQGLISQLDYFNKKVAAKDLSGYYLLHKGDFAYNKSYSQGYPMGAIKPLKLYEKGVVSTLYICFRANKGFCSEFYEHYFEAGILNQQIEGIAQEGGRAHGLLNVSVKEFFKDVDILVPTLEEQQKIADCLTSIDKLITLHIQKLDVLKDHKKGLLQQLFPAEGETLPKFRFPEFGECGKWERKLISSVTQITTGGKDTQNKVEDGKYPFFVRSQTIERINSYSFDGEAVLTSGDGIGVGKIYHYINGKFDFHQRVYCIYDFSEEVSGKFFYLYFSEHFYRRVMRLSAKNSVDSVRMAMIADMEILLPKKDEQRKIVDAVFSLQEIIDRQEVKVDSLKEHKKGLVQKIFPAMDETI